MTAPRVRMGNTIDEAVQLADVLRCAPEHVWWRLNDQLWLKMVLRRQRRCVAVAERQAFDERADRILALLDPPWEPA